MYRVVILSEELGGTFKAWVLAMRFCTLTWILSEICAGGGLLYLFMLNLQCGMMKIDVKGTIDLCSLISYLILSTELLLPYWDLSDFLYVISRNDSALRLRRHVQPMLGPSHFFLNIRLIRLILFKIATLDIICCNGILMVLLTRGYSGITKTIIVMKYTGIYCTTGFYNETMAYLEGQALEHRYYDTIYQGPTMAFNTGMTPFNWHIEIDKFDSSLGEG